MITIFLKLLKDTLSFYVWYIRCILKTETGQICTKTLLHEGSFLHESKKRIKCIKHYKKPRKKKMKNNLPNEGKS